MITTPTLQQLQRGLAISEQIAALETELAAIFNGSAPAAATLTATAAPVKAKRKISEEHRAKLAAAAKARWAKVPAVSKAPVAAKAPAKKKRTMSAEARAKIGEAMKARWTARKAAK